ncbi:MAG: 1-acyl-sn-glycerol-3-phosphate acyltransferase [Bacteroidales bacterium]
MDSAVSLHIDIEKAIKNKAPETGRKIPGFVYRFLANLICQDQMNELLVRNGNRYGVDFADGILKDMEVKVVMEGEENIPAAGNYIFASNHPLGGLDGMALVKIFGDKFDKKVRFIVNDLLMNIPNLATVFVPINKHGNQGKENAALLNDAFSSENQILIFPAGLCSRLQNGQIRDLEWKKAVVAKSVEYQRDIVPVFFEGTNSSFFYRLGYWRKKLGIKVNLEMALLPKEMFKNTHKTFVVRIGKPIPWQTFDKSKSQKNWAEYLKNKVYELQLH